jgi:hypothetical protein
VDGDATQAEIGSLAGRGGLVRDGHLHGRPGRDYGAGEGRNARVSGRECGGCRARGAGSGGRSTRRSPLVAGPVPIWDGSEASALTVDFAGASGCPAQRIAYQAPCWSVRDVPLVGALSAFMIAPGCAARSHPPYGAAWRGPGERAPEDRKDEVGQVACGRTGCWIEWHPSRQSWRA